MIHLLTTVCALLASPVASAASVTTFAPTAAVRQSSAEVLEILNATYEQAKKGYDQQRLDAAKGKATAPTRHPAEEFYWRFELLAKEGVAPARAWMLANLNEAFPKKEDRSGRAAALVEELLKQSPDEPLMLEVVAAIQRVAGDVGKEKAIAWLQGLVDATKDPEIAARSILAQAGVITEGGKLTLTEAQDEARELRRLVVAAYPKTKAAREASGNLIPAVQADFVKAELDWVENVRELQRLGRDATTWPPQPVARFVSEFLPLAEAGHQDAMKWVNTLAPAFQQAEKQGQGYALSYLVERLGVFYPKGVEDWARVRMGILTLIYQQFPGEKWIYKSVLDLMSEVDALPARSGIEPMRALLATTKDEQVAEGVASEKNAKNEKLRALATFVLAQTCRAAGDQRSYEEALGYYAAIVQKYKADDVAGRARTQAEELRAVMPGQPAPELTGKNLRDEDNLEFRLHGYLGRVVMLEFWSFMDERCTQVLPERIALAEHMKGKPFAMLGASLDRATLAVFQDYKKKLGVTWRSCLLGSGQNAVTDEWQVRRRPTTILIDEKGIIRARDLPWTEMVKLADELVAKVPPPTPK